MAVDSKIEIKVFRRSVDDEPVADVRLFSSVMPGRISNMEIEFGQHIGRNAFLAAVEVAGGALAEHQDTQCGDEHDPATCAALARDIMAELLDGM